MLRSIPTYMQQMVTLNDLQKDYRVRMKKGGSADIAANMWAGGLNVEEYEEAL